MSKRIPGVTIGIVFYNEQERISKCLSALLLAYRFYLRTSPSVPIEFIFADNGSVDLSPRVVEEFCRKNDLPYTLYFSETNNMARSRNQILLLSKHQYLLFIDADCCPQESWISKYLEMAGKLQGERWAALGGENFPPLSESETFYQCQRLLKKNPLLFLNSTQLLSPDKNQNVWHVPTCNVLYRAEVLQDLGGFHDSFVRVGEDLQLSARLIQNGWKIIFIQGVAVEHFDRTDFKGWFLKCLRYGSVQPRILFSYPTATSRLRWIPFLLIITLCLLFSLTPLVAGLGVLAMSLLVPVFVSVLNRNFKNILPWIIFLNGTIISYCLGYIFGSCKTVLPLLKLQSAKTINETD
ncbi:MAG: glycosyltransferase [Bdellovibrio sp.]|nr:glycosyltransferase [Bdellovibrio sp.]